MIFVFFYVSKSYACILPIPIVHGENANLESVLYIQSAPLDPSTPATHQTDLHRPFDSLEQHNPQPPPLTHSTRPKNVPTYLNDYYYEHFGHIPQPTPSPSNPNYHFCYVLTDDNCTSDYKSFCLHVSSIHELNNYNQTSKYDCWVSSMNT